MLEQHKIFYAITNIGHPSKMDARSLIEAADYLYPNKFRQIINDVLANGETYIGKKLGKRYSSNIARYNVMYDIAYKLSDVRLNMYINKEAGKKIIEATMHKIKKEKPDLIVSLSPLINRIIFESLKNLKMQIPTAMVFTHNKIKPSALKAFTRNITDFDKYIVISENVKKELIEKVNVKETKIKLVEYPVKINFEVLPDESQILELKKHFDLPIDRRIVLFYGRENGYKNIEKIVKGILKNERLLKNGFYIIITRNNKKQYDTLFNMVEDKNSFRVIGFSDQFYEYITISDLLLSTADTTNLKEGLLLNKPIIITSFAEKSEKENINFFVENNYGIYEKNPHKIILELENLILNIEKLETIKNNYKNSSFKNGMIEIAEELIDLMQEKNKFDKKEKIAKRSGFLRKKKREKLNQQDINK